MEIPRSLIAAKTALDAAIANEAALASAAAAGAGAASAATRLPELDQEIERLNGIILADDALAGIAGAAAARLSAEARLTAEADLDARRAERDDVAQKARAGEAAARALQAKIAESAAEKLAARRILAKEMRRFLVALEAEFAGDVGNMLLPALYRKWSAITAGVRFSPISICLATMQIGVPGAAAPILLQGCYRGPAGETDWLKAWREDRTLVALQQQLAEIAAACGNPYALEHTIRMKRHEEQSRANDAENRRRQAEYQRANVSHERVAPAMTSQEREAAEQAARHGRQPFSGGQSYTLRTGGRTAQP